jgi:hypothetical protein
VAYSLSQSTTAKTGTGAASLTSNAFGSNTVAGQLVVVFVSVFNTTISSVTDNKSNTYTLAGTTITAGNSRVAIYYSFITTGGSGHTCTANFGASDDCCIVTASFDNSSGSADGSSIGQTATGSTATSGNMTPSTTTDLLVGAVTYDGSGNTTSATSGWTLISKSDVTAAAQPLGAEYRILSSSSAIGASFDFTGSFTYACRVMLFKEPSITTGEMMAARQMGTIDPPRDRIEIVAY